MKDREQAIFFTDRVEANSLSLHEQEAVHCSLVLRKQPGDLIWVTDGKGMRYTCGIQSLGKHEVQCEILRSESHPNSATLQLVVAPTKNRDRMEWMVEKAVELGVLGIHMVQTERTERQKNNLDRLYKKALSAMKQAQRYHLPGIKEWEWSDLLQQDGSMRYIAHCLDSEGKVDPSVLSEEGEKWVLIGPEGDFSPEEITEALDAGWRPLDLGTARLRTETAALAVCVWSNPV